MDFRRQWKYPRLFRSATRMRWKCLFFSSTLFPTTIVFVFTCRRLLRVPPGLSSSSLAFRRRPSVNVTVLRQLRRHRRSVRSSIMFILSEKCQFACGLFYFLLSDIVAFFPVCLNRFRIRCAINIGGHWNVIVTPSVESIQSVRLSRVVL